jgi:dUTP pyrophosphatase
MLHKLLAFLGFRTTLKIKLLSEDAQMPVYSTEGSACMDLFASSNANESKEGFIEYNTGIAIEIPKGYVAYIFPRSSVSKRNLTLCNSVGVIDSDYRGEIKFRFYKIPKGRHRQVGAFIQQEIDFNGCNLYKKGDKIGQLMLVKNPPLLIKQTNTLSKTERGTGGFGSTGN